MWEHMSYAKPSPAGEVTSPRKISSGVVSMTPVVIAALILGLHDPSRLVRTSLVKLIHIHTMLTTGDRDLRQLIPVLGPSSDVS
jgi:hypothetical protein